MTHQLFALYDKQTKEIDSIYTYSNLSGIFDNYLFSSLGYFNHPDLISEKILNKIALFPIYSVRCNAPTNILYYHKPYNSAKQFRLIKHFADKLSARKYYIHKHDLPYNVYFYDDVNIYNLPTIQKIDDYGYIPEKNAKQHRKSHTYKYSKRHIKTNNLVYNQKYNDFKHSKLKHCNRKHDNSWYDHNMRQSRFSRGWKKNKKLQHQWQKHNNKHDVLHFVIITIKNNKKYGFHYSICCSENDTKKLNKKKNKIINKLNNNYVEYGTHILYLNNNSRNVNAIKEDPYFRDVYFVKKWKELLK